ncbi:conjugal transfer protein TraL [Vibrio vulnificus]|uniref:conjugal transfer protein TraL n=1 Tax=Vibrio vulnificus TaxID=672 RepID=UPI00405A4621
MKNLVLALSVLVLGFYTPKKSFAANEADCSIWLCLPVGFPSGCESAKKAFKKRIRKGKSPLPSLSSCIVSPPAGLVDTPSEDIELPKPSVMTSKTGHAALIEAHTICKRWRHINGKNSERVCIESEYIPKHAIHDTYCHYMDNGRDRYPDKCINTIKYVQTFMDGVQYGETYYFDSSGNKVHIPQ